MTIKKNLLLAVIIALIAAFFALNLGQYLSLDYLQDQRLNLLAYYQANPFVIAGTYFLIYILVTGLSIPGASVLTLAAGAIFGLVEGTILVSFASTLGATGAFLVSRFLLRDYVQTRFAERLKQVNAGIARDGAYYLFTLRLIPLLPFFLVNLLMGLTRMRVRTYFWVSQLGMLAGTIVYVNAGTQLAQITQASDILSVKLIGAFVLLGLFPLLAKWLSRFLQRRRVYARWKKPARFDRNLIVIGGGAAGLVTSYIAATVKAKVTLVEAHKMGGDCLNYGCVPSKALIRSAKLARQMRDAERYGLPATSPDVDFPAVMQRVNQVITEVAPHDSIERYSELGVDVQQGYARLIDPWTVEITDANGELSTLTTRSIVIATGARPFVPPLPGLEEVGYVTSDTLWDAFSKLDAAPARLLVLGGGPIGCELAQSFARLGSQVIQVEMGPHLLSREDAEVSALVEGSLKADGVEVLTSHRALRCEKDGDQKVMIAEQDGKEVRLVCDEILCAVGRSARLTGFGLEDLGITTERTVSTNDYLETLYPNIYAAGDVAGPYQFTHSAAHQAWYAAVNALFGIFWRFKADYSVIPNSTFVDPSVARVGLNETQAKQQDVAHEVTRYELEELDRAIADSATQGFIKVITPPKSDRILGVTIVGEHAAELLAEFVLAMRHGLGLNKILSTIHTYPTLSEANKYTAGEWKKARMPERLLSWVARYHTWRRS